MALRLPGIVQGRAGPGQIASSSPLDVPVKMGQLDLPHGVLVAMQRTPRVFRSLVPGRDFILQNQKLRPYRRAEASGILQCRAI